MNGLFKYFPADLDKVEMLARYQIQLTPPKYFNDPWDFLAPREPVTDDEIRALLERAKKEFRGKVPSFPELKAGSRGPSLWHRKGQGCKTA